AVQLCDLTTIRLGGPAGRYEIAPDSARLVELVSAADAAGEPVLVLGGGSNLVVGDAGFDGLVVQVCSQGFELQDSRVRVDAGVEWDS
ncbi:FAD-binding protein, partial [Vibrio parahaemolyticus]